MKQLSKIILLVTIIGVGLISSVTAQAQELNTNSQYYEIEFTYTNVINGKRYVEEAVLLRDKSWLDNNHIGKSGDTMILNIPEFGVVDARATARSIEVSDANPEEVYTKDSSMVTGTFKHYSVDVREYTLQDSKTGITQTMQATPNHAFYVQNRTAFNKALKQQSHFIEIQDITPEDHMLNEAGNEVQLVCGIKLDSSNKRTASGLSDFNNKITTRDNTLPSNCYKQLVNNNKPIAVYNLEIFKQHQYLVVSDKTIDNQDSNDNNQNNKQPSANITTINAQPNSNLNIAVNNAILVHNACKAAGIHAQLRKYNNTGLLHIRDGNLVLEVSREDALVGALNYQEYRPGWQSRSSLVQVERPSGKTIQGMQFPSGSILESYVTPPTEKLLKKTFAIKMLQMGLKTEHTRGEGRAFETYRWRLHGAEFATVDEALSFYDNLTVTSRSSNIEELIANRADALALARQWEDEANAVLPNSLDNPFYNLNDPLGLNPDALLPNPWGHPNYDPTDPLGLRNL